MKAKMELAIAKQRAEALIEQLRPGCQRIVIAGSIRRKKALVGDIEIVLVPKIEKREEQSGLGRYLDMSVTKNANLFEERLRLMQDQGKFRFGKNGSKYKELIYPNFKVDLFIADASNFGLILMIRTGSAEYTKNFMVELNKRKRYKVKNGYLWHIANDNCQKVAVPDESTLYDIVGFPCRDPAERISSILKKKF